MDLIKFKDSIGKNLFAFVGWIGVLGFILLGLWFKSSPNEAFGFIAGFCLMAVLALLGLSYIVYAIELIWGKKISNKFILENKFYNIFWILGVSFSILFLLSYLTLLLLPFVMILFE
jgi:uncharacterized BrkB/YihY/UPF0761 family membrane protein